MDHNILFVLPKDSHTLNSFLSRQLTLRICNRDSRYIIGSDGDNEDLPELDNNKVPGKIAPLRTFDNTFGHWNNGITRVFNIQHTVSFHKFLDRIKSHIEYNTSRGNLWDLPNTVLVSDTDIEKEIGKYPPQFIYVYRTQMNSQYAPICAHNVKAYMESERLRGRNNVIFGIPSQSTVVTGTHGTTHINTLLEMGFDEEEGQKDHVKRTYNPLWKGFICSGHTAHSADAGKSRRVSAFTRIRLIHDSILEPLRDIPTYTGEKDWICYCMGYTCNLSYDEVYDIVHKLNDMSRDYYEDQFINGTSSGTRLCPASYFIYEDEKILYLSISSGVIMRSTPSDTMVDSYMIKQQGNTSIIRHQPLPESGENMMKFMYSIFFLLGVFLDQDRPPRTLFASGQTTQAIAFPWAIGNARVSPQHASMPLVESRFVRQMEDDLMSNPGALWDIYPGEDLTICYMNTDTNYEDSMMLSSAFADRGGFASLSLCTYRISEADEIPDVGEKLCGKKYKWWKMECTSTCVCKMKNGNKLVSTSANIPSARVHQIIRTEDGAISIKVLSFSQILTGDKISTMHGQKGVVHIIPQHELPVISMKDGTTFIADLYMAVGSIVSRQTSGQVFESSYGLRAARSGIRSVVEGDINKATESGYIINSVTGKLVTEQYPDGTIRPISATVGITRIIAQTQMTREKHHLTHRPEGKYSTGTRSGRADGGGVAASEMDFHAMYASGLIACAQELLDRGNMTVIPVCKTCHAIAPLHDCDQKDNMAMTRMPYDTAVFDMISAAAIGSCNRYMIEHT